MLGMRNYPQDYIDATRRRIDTDLTAYRTITSSDGFETVFFNNMVLVLEASFVHRLRVVEGKDGNPLNEVRVLAGSLLDNAGVLTPDKTVKLKPETSILGLRPGDRIALDETRFVKLADAFFAELEAKFV
jgi:hypothetical protein